ncbi:hypothetical protein D0Z07_1430 [Hyphodiscus hymeniophilus]|uniref:Uncharacterized protein n=1 Tax=Hyphodiscus hymeniophilus TaxID=353542 RepID=A0A9P7B037_9HELO|nr:hypothetical protein D0Z07_1430 [Hyphodiscus hymeniophilus]
MTPRKTQARNKNQPSQPHTHPLHQVQASDYDSETPYDPVSLPTRTNTELNLSALRRYLPSITDIPSLASSTDVYAYSPTAQAWERAETCGTMFVCELNHGEGYCIMILNKKGLDNLTIDMLDMQDVEITTEFLIVRYMSKEVGDERVLGFFIHDGPVGTRDTNNMLIKRCWEKVMEENGGVQNGAVAQQDLEERVAPVPGQKLSISELFGRQVV